MHISTFLHSSIFSVFCNIFMKMCGIVYCRRSTIDDIWNKRNVYVFKIVKLLDSQFSTKINLNVSTKKVHYLKWVSSQRTLQLKNTHTHTNNKYNCQTFIFLLNFCRWQSQQSFMTFNLCAFNSIALHWMENKGLEIHVTK